MRVATFELNGRRGVGIVSADGKTVQPLDLDPAHARLGVLALVDAAVAGQPLPAPAGAPVDIGSVRLEAPIPRPRRNIFCVGRNYHEHAKELSGSVFKDNNPNPVAWPIVFTKVPERYAPTIEAIKESLRAGRLTEERLAQSVQRILRLKQARGLFEPAPFSAESLAARSSRRLCR